MTLDMKLIAVDPSDEAHLCFLWRLLSHRPADAVISHKAMPTWDQHCAFVRDHPYADWRLIAVDVPNLEMDERKSLQLVGSVFISQPARPSVVGDEVSVELDPRWRGCGFAERALVEIMSLHPRPRYLANVAPENYTSMALFKRVGFSLCQLTFERMVEGSNDSA